MLSFTARYNIDKSYLELDKVKRALRINALEIEGVAKQKVNVDTARLQSSIDTTVENSGKTIVIGSNVEYAAAQESINSYLEFALEKQKPLLKLDIEKAIKG